VTTLTIRLPDGLRSELDKLSREENKAVSDIVRKSLRRYVAVERFRALHRKILPFAEAQGLLSEVGRKVRRTLRLPRALVEEYVHLVRDHAEILSPDRVKTGLCCDPADEMVLGLEVPGRQLWTSDSRIRRSPAPGGGWRA